MAAAQTNICLKSTSMWINFLLAAHLHQLVKREGTGTELPMIGDTVFVHYVGTLLDGTQFDSSRHRENAFSFELGKGLFDKPLKCKGSPIASDRR